MVLKGKTFNNAFSEVKLNSAVPTKSTGNWRSLQQEIRVKAICRGSQIKLGALKKPIVPQLLW